jgi:hypothetical protein
MPHKVTRLSIGGLNGIKRRQHEGSTTKRLRKFEEIDFFGTKYQVPKITQSPRLDQTSYTNIWDVTPSKDGSDVKRAIISDRSPAPNQRTRNMII